MVLIFISMYICIHCMYKLFMCVWANDLFLYLFLVDSIFHRLPEIKVLGPAALRMRLRRLCETKSSGKSYVDEKTKEDYKAGGDRREILEIALVEALKKWGTSFSVYKKVKARLATWWKHVFNLYIYIYLSVFYHACKPLRMFVYTNKSWSGSWSNGVLWHTYIFIYVYIYICIYLFLWICIYIYTCIYIYVFIYVCLQLGRIHAANAMKPCSRNSWLGWWSSGNGSALVSKKRLASGWRKRGWRRRESIPSDLIWEGLTSDPLGIYI